MFGFLDCGFRSSTPRTTRRSAPRRRQRTNLLLERMEDRTVPSSLTFTGSGLAPNGATNSAEVDFNLTTPGQLSVTLINTSTQTFNQNTGSTNVLQPTNVLTGVLFDIGGSPALSKPAYANLASDRPVTWLTIPVR